MTGAAQLQQLQQSSVRGRAGGAARGAQRLLALPAFCAFRVLQRGSLNNGGRLAVLRVLSPLLTKWGLYLVPVRAESFCVSALAVPGLVFADPPKSACSAQGGPSPELPVSQHSAAEALSPLCRWPRSRGCACSRSAERCPHGCVSVTVQSPSGTQFLRTGRLGFGGAPAWGPLQGPAGPSRWGVLAGCARRINDLQRAVC